jgi:branched-chain amino acid transport system permease protein
LFDILPQLLVNALISGSIYALAAAGLSLIYGLLRVMNFAHGHLMMVGAYIFYMFSVEHGHNLFVAAILTALTASAVGWLCLRIFIIPFQELSFLLPLVTSLALSNILEAIVSMVFGVNVKSLSPGVAAQSIEIRGVYITPIQILIILSAIILLSTLAFIVHSTSLGRKIRALRENPFAAESLGTSGRAVNMMIFILATLLATYAGILVGYETNMQPTMGTTYTIKAFAAMILGGLGNIWGTVVGAYILGLVENLAIGLDFGGYSIPAGYKDAFAFMIILIMLLFRPEGLFNKKGRKA